MAKGREPLLLDANVVIDYAISDLGVLGLVARHIGHVHVVRSVLDEVEQIQEADCGRLGDDRLEGEALVAFTLFAEPNGRTTRIQINSTMRTQAHRRGSSGKLRPSPVYPCASTGRFEANLLDEIRLLVKE